MPAGNSGPPEMVQVSGLSSDVRRWSKTSATSPLRSQSSSKSIVFGAKHSYADMQKDAAENIGKLHSANFSRSSLDPTNFDDFLSETNDEWDADSDNEKSANKSMLFPPRQRKESAILTEQPSPLSTAFSGSSSKATPVGGSSGTAAAVPSYPYPNLHKDSLEGLPSSNSVDVGVMKNSDIGHSSLESSSTGVRNDVETLAHDPFELLKRAESPSSDFSTLTEQELAKQDAAIKRFNKFKSILHMPTVDLGCLRQISWSGIPQQLRPVVWQLLLGYCPANSDRRKTTLARKRREYEDAAAMSFAKGTSGLDQTIWHQIHIDVPRTNPGIRLYQYPTTQKCLERILYVWALRHPASGYVQGINDLVTPFFQVFLSSYIDVDPETFDTGMLPKDVLSTIEADSFWCLSKLLDGIQDNYIFAQPGIQRQVNKLHDLIHRIDTPLAKHLSDIGIEFIQFAFRWMNCMLMREVSVKNTIRMWDTYLSEEQDGFSEFHVYVCGAFLVKWSERLRQMDFQGVMMFLQSLPTQGWIERDIELLLSEAFMWKSLFHNAQNHLSITPQPGMSMINP